MLELQRAARRDDVHFLAALLSYGVFYATFFVQSFLSGNYIAPGDSLDFGVADYLSAPAYWTDGMYSGYPIAADPQSLTWYPVLQLFRAIGADWNVFLTAAYVIASATCFLLVRRLTRSNLAGAFSGLVCGFSALMLGYIANFNQIHAFAWVPLVLYGLQLVREGLYRHGAAVAAIASALMWLAGHPQVPVYAMYAAVAFIGGSLVVDRPDKLTTRRRLRWSALALALGFAMAAIEIVPMLELSRFSGRADSSWELYSSSALPPRELLTLLAPFAFGGFWTASGGLPYVGETGDSAYVGLLPVALALAGPIISHKYSREARLWAAIGVVEILLSLGAATPVGTLFFYAPGVSVFQAPLRHLFFVSLCFAVTAGVAYAGLIVPRQSGGRVAAAAAVTAVLTAIGFALLVRHDPAVRSLLEGPGSYLRWAIGWPLLISSLLIALMLVARWLPQSRGGAVVLALLLIAVQVGDLAMLHYRLPGRRFAYADIVRSEAVLHPKMTVLRDEMNRTGERVLAADGSQNQFLLPNLTRAWGIRAASGTGSLGIQRYVEIMGMGPSGKTSPDVLSMAHRGIDLFAVRYVLVREDSSLAGELEQQSDRWQRIESLHYYESDPDTYYVLLRNRRALPRAWCAAHVLEIHSVEALEAIRTGRLPDGSDFDPSRTVLVEPDVVGRSDVRSGVRQGGVVVADARERRYAVNASAPCMLVLSEVYYPWWRATIDAEPAEPVRVNYAMTGVAVPPGSHVIRLSMRPISVWIGATVTGVGLLVWTLLVIGWLRIPRPAVFTMPQTRR
jgi:hypothetical protein